MTFGTVVLVVFVIAIVATAVVVSNRNKPSAGPLDGRGGPGGDNGGSGTQNES